ncbi:hypothetical protein N7463_004531 [Penicillium fimorum]|uniref:Uncharacterized protein n=1 Tax=Penicillium fimorum TaxID=1882269 RepID=A0A9W9Y4Q4_9EURO|nr:hypothetical protein N7463_004531 [Penicillium fimorum]
MTLSNPNRLPPVKPTRPSLLIPQPSNPRDIRQPIRLTIAILPPRKLQMRPEMSLDDREPVDGLLVMEGKNPISDSSGSNQVNYLCEYTDAGHSATTHAP